MNSYTCRHFKIQELVHPDDMQFPEWKLWLAFDRQILEAADHLWDDYGPWTINDWHRGGKFKERGLRRFNSTTGAMFSQHKFGRGLDLVPWNCTVDVVRSDIIARKKEYMRLITRVEMDIPWLHIDCGNSNRDDVIKIYP